MSFTLALVSMGIIQVYAATSSKYEMYGNVMNLFDVDYFGYYQDIITSFCKGFILTKDEKLCVM